ncbi:MAG: flavodoxin-dependent (E)-4-hydroxy-3-methylbut-2-enyl-diphosphate synthase, partial [Lentisphaeria bacterium]
MIQEPQNNQFRESFDRHRTRQIKVGDVCIGGDAPITIQSMTTTDTRAPDTTLEQIEELAQAGCQLIRVAVPDQTAVEALSRILRDSPLPVIADVHFQSKLALAALEVGVHCLRINPGTINDPRQLRQIARTAGELGTPIRIGVNSGSIENHLLDKYGGPVAGALVESALHHCEFFEANHCSNLKVSLKSSNTPITVAAYRKFAAQSSYPLHLGVTEAGTLASGTVKSAVAIGTLLMEGIGDTFRVSLSAPPIEEIHIGRRILEACGLRQARPEIISCPTCGRTEIDLLAMVKRVESEVEKLKRRGYRINLNKIAVMGCIVNGPGEAREADLGIAGGRGRGVLFRKGQTVAT